MSTLAVRLPVALDLERFARKLPEMYRFFLEYLHRACPPDAYLGVLDSIGLPRSHAC